jgi:hypothetical protein
MDTLRIYLNPTQGAFDASNSLIYDALPATEQFRNGADNVFSSLVTLVVAARARKQDTTQFSR